MKKKLLMSFLCLCTGTYLFAQTKHTIRVMSFNLWHGGDACKLPVDTVVKYQLAAIRSTGVKVVGFQEQTSNLSGNSSRAQLLADSLGWNCYIISSSRAVIAEFPMEPLIPSPKTVNGQPATPEVVMLTLPGGRKFAFSSLHLMYTPYEPYDIADKKLKSRSAAEASAVKSRLHEVKNVQQVLQTLDKKTPVVLVGDFNEPSCLDWTTQAIRDRNDVQLPFSVNWPASRFLLNNGYKDAYREVYPNVKNKPGYTWTSLPGLWRKPEIPDRIDLIHVSGKTVTVRNAWIVGERSDMTDLVIAPWPSDHRAVVVEITL